MNGGITDPRNPNIFKMFAMLDIGERAGSGLNTIRIVWQDIGWEKPELNEVISPERTILSVPIEMEESEGIKSKK
jgi:predicted HTH transcriptional regulator